MSIKKGANASAALGPMLPDGAGVITVGGEKRVYFNALRQFNRSALELSHGNLYISFASHGDNGPYHGWILRYDQTTLALNGALNLTPDGTEGGVWMAGAGPSIIGPMAW